MCFLLLGCSSQGSSLPAPSDGVTTAVAPSPSPTTATEGDFCSRFLADQKAAADAIGRALRDPTAARITVQDLQAASAKLQADALNAPPDLRDDVQVQIDTLNTLIRQLSTGRFRGLDLNAFENAQKALILHCRSGA